MLRSDSTKDYKEGYRDALQMVIDVAAESPEGSELIRIMQAANRGIIDADFLIKHPWH